MMLGQAHKIKADQGLVLDSLISNQYIDPVHAEKFGTFNGTRPRRSNKNLLILWPPNF